MNATTTVPSPSEVHEMRKFLARVMRTPLQAINLATGENTDLLRRHHARTLEDGQVDTITEKLCSVEAIRIDNILAGHTDRLPDGTPDLARGAALYAAFLATRETIQP